MSETLPSPSQSHSEPPIETKLEYDSTEGADESVDSPESIEPCDSQALEPQLLQDEEGVANPTRMEPGHVPVPPSSKVFLATAPRGPGPAGASPARSPASPASPGSSWTETGKGRKRRAKDPVEQEILRFVQRKARTLNVVRANEEESLTAFGHLLPFYRQLPPLKQIQFLHHMSGYLMELYAECCPQEN